MLATMLEGILLPSNVVAKTTYCLYLVKRLIVMLRCAVNGASIKPGTWNIPEHSGTSRNIPEHEKIEIFFYEKIIN